MSQGKPAISRIIALSVVCEHCRRKTAQYLDILLTEESITCTHKPCGQVMDLTQGENALILSKLAQACREIRDASNTYRAFPPESQFDRFRDPET